MKTEREKFLGWWERNKSLDCDEYSAFEIWQAAKASAIPEGYCVVPKEPTDLMINTYRDKSIAPISTLSVYGYKAMIEVGELK